MIILTTVLIYLNMKQRQNQIKYEINLELQLRTLYEINAVLVCLFPKLWL